MTHPLYDYLCEQLDELLQKHKVVVVYDPRSDFETFFSQELKETGATRDKLKYILICERPTLFARYEGSFFGLRYAVEPIVDLVKPDFLVVYVSGVERDRRGSVLMEIEKGGVCYEPQLKRLALSVLRKRFSDVQIDEMLRAPNVDYEDIVSFLRQIERGQSASALGVVFNGLQSEALLAHWVVNDDKDAFIVEKDAVSELFKVISSRIGIELPSDMPVTEARRKVQRYLLVGEFRSDLACEAPTSVSMVPKTFNEEMIKRIREICQISRRLFPDRYVEIADSVERDLDLKGAKIDRKYLGSIDTFRFEEMALLSHAGELIAERDYGKALGIVTNRSRSFWVDRDVSRQAQWEACRLMAELGREIDRIRPAMSKMPNDPAKWVSAYSAENGWFIVDSLQRRLETWVAKMDEEPESEKALGVVRREHEELLKRMADGFAKALADSKWAISGIMHQTRIYPDVVQAMGGRVGYFFVDAMRFEMGVELARQLENTKDLTIRPAVAALPSITPVGMAALLPGASASFSVIDHKGKLAAKIEGTSMPTLAERLKFLKTKVPDAIEITLGKVLSTSRAKLGKAIGDSALVVVRSQEIDFVGEMDGDLLARQTMDTVIGNLARAIRRLSGVGIDNFVISADHGHQFSIRKDDDMKTDNPGGDTLDLHRRCWIGHGGTTPTGTVRVTGADLGYDTNLDFVFPTGLGVFRAGGGLCFHHGSTSLQEIVVPVVSLRIPKGAPLATTEKAAQLRGVPDKLTNRTFGVRVLIANDMFAPEPVTFRVVLISNNAQVGQTGMAVGAEFDRTTGILSVKPGTEVNVGLMLTRDDCNTVRVVVQDPATDAVLDQSDEIPVKLGM